jgi:signal transduction histidine kinase
MTRLSAHALARRSWWWVFALFIALPAVALALLGVDGLRADEIARQQRALEEQAQMARVADASLSNVLEAEVAEARHLALDRGGLIGDPPPSVVFRMDGPRGVSFPGDRVFAGPFGAEPPREAVRPLRASTRTRIEKALAADAQSRVAEAKSLYEEVGSDEAARGWAELQLLLLGPAELTPSRIASIADPRRAGSSEYSPSGIPLAMVASAVSQDVSGQARAQFLPLLEQTLDNLRRGRWWLSLEARLAYDAELRRWLSDAGSTRDAGADGRLQAIEELVPEILSAFARSHGVPPRVDTVGMAAGRQIIVWTRPADVSRPWTGVVISGPRVDTLFATALAPLELARPFLPIIAGPEGSPWAVTAVDGPQGRRLALDSLSGWSITFPDRQDDGGQRTLLNYARVLFPLVVLGFGLVMTAWIMRREMALTALQATFVASVTHEFKSPITSIRLLIERLAGRSVPPETVERYHTAIGAEADRLETLVNRLLTAQTLHRGRVFYTFREAALEAIVQEALVQMRPQADARRIELSLNSASAIPALALDAESVSDAVRNLVDNAIKYSPDGTRVEVTLAAHTDRVELSVSDQGIGVDPADTERIFEPFVRSRRGDHANVHGTGLGLSLVKATAEAHGGSVTVRSSDVGSRFTVVFPLMSAVHTEQ